MSAAKKGGGLKVTAPLVQVTDDKGTVTHLYLGDVVPDGTSQESIDNLKDLDYVEDTDAPAQSDKK